MRLWHRGAPNLLDKIRTMLAIVYNKPWFNMTAPFVPMTRAIYEGLPEEVQRIGVTVRKSSPDLMLVIHLISPDGSLDQQYISNYASINIKDVITRIDGVGDTIVFGARDYAMRVWLDPAKVQSRNLTASDVVAALRAANASGER